MAENITSKMVDAIREVENAMVQQKFETISSASRASRLSETDILRALQEYGGEVTKAPDDFLKQLQVVRIASVFPPEWAVDFDLWIDHRHSDLTLSLTIRTNKDGNLIALIDDLHVL